MRNILIKIKDKKIISKTNFCPPHYMPHKFPIGDKVRDEPCHIHKAKWRMCHHLFFCKKLKCAHYEKMKARHEKGN